MIRRGQFPIDLEIAKTIPLDRDFTTKELGLQQAIHKLRIEGYVRRGRRVKYHHEWAATDKLRALMTGERKRCARRAFCEDGLDE